MQFDIITDEMEDLNSEGRTTFFENAKESEDYSSDTDPQPIKTFIQTETEINRVNRKKR